MTILKPETRGNKHSNSWLGITAYILAFLPGKTSRFGRLN